MSRRHRVLVVGGGVAGMVAAIRAAGEGAQVALMEGLGELGGRARSREVRGFRFNQGPHALYLGSEAGRELRALGIELSGVRPPASGGLARFEGRLFALPVGLASLLRSGLVPASEKLSLGRWLAGLGRADLSRLEGVSLDAALAEQLPGERSRALARALVRLTSYTHAPEVQSAGSALRQLRDAQAGVLYLDHGWSQLVRALERAACEAGVHVHRRMRARRVEVGDARQVVVSDDEQRFAVDVVVLALGPTEAAALLGTGCDPALRELADRSLPVRAATLDVGLSSLPRPERTFCLGIDEPTYFSVHSLARALAPEGAAQVQIARYLRPDEKPERRELEAELHGLLDQLQPGWRARVVTQKLRADLRVTHAVVTARQGGLAGRPAVSARERPGVLVAGDWVGPRGQLVDASFASGSEAGRLAARGA